MNEINEHWSNSVNSYGYGIICQDCFARKYSEGGYDIKLVSTGTFVRVHSVRDEEVLFCIVHDDMQVDANQFLCKKTDVIHVPESLWAPLFTVKKFDRLPLVEDGRAAEVLGRISIGDTVQVLGPDNLSACIANVTFRNVISRLGVGVFFGLQVIASKENLQSLIKKVSLIEPGTKGFPRGCDLVVTVDKLRPLASDYADEKLQHSASFFKEIQKDQGKNVLPKEDSSNLNFKSTAIFNFKEKISNPLKKAPQSHLSESDHGTVLSSVRKTAGADASLAVGEEVVFMDGNCPEKGTIRWIGKVKNVQRVEVEFENPIRNEASPIEGTEFFKSKHKHSVTLPPSAIIKLSDYTMNNPKEKIQHKINNNNNASNNINNINNNNNNNNNNHYHHYINNTSSSGGTNNNNNNNSSHFNFNNNNENDNKAKNLTSCCAIKRINDEKYKMLKGLSNSRHCLKHGEKKMDNELILPKNSEEFFRNKYPGKNGDQQFESQLRINPKSSDYGNESKMNCRKYCSSSDCDLDNLTDSKVQNSTASVQGTQLRCPNQGGSAPQSWSGTGGREAFDSLAPFCHSDEGTATTTKFEEQELWDSRRPGRDESPPRYYDAPRPADPALAASRELTKGSVVELTYGGVPLYGVIRWIGALPEEPDGCPPRLVAGVEMEEESDGFTDGTLDGRRYFQCNPRKGLFVPLSRCRKDSRFSDEAHRLDPAINYGQIDCPPVEGTVPPINRKEDVESVCGKNRGIQGHHNSCYLDATLFSMFAFTSVFDSVLYRPPGKHDIPQYGEVQRVLREEIVNPLRKNLYVRADRVMKLRTLLDRLSSVSGLTSEEKDPEEFLNSLLAQILKAEPFLKLISGQEAFHHQLFVEKDDRLSFPSVQQLFEQSFVTSDIKLKQIPSCLIIQMPRFGKSFKMYSRILPPQLLDVTDVIENSPRQCTVCGKLAEFECKDCFGQQGIGSGLEGISFCKTCLETAHTHHCRVRHDYRSLTVPEEFFELREHCVIPRLYLELFAVVCIETSHYVAFVKCGSGSDAPWCFFDSMADRKGEQNGYNIPEMVPCPDLPYWLSEEGAKVMNEMSDDRQLPEHAKRLFSDAYMCMYQSPDLMMYR